jgi:hypothetical protein
MGISTPDCHRILILLLLFLAVSLSGCDERAAARGGDTPSSGGTAGNPAGGSSSIASLAATPSHFRISGGPTSVPKYSRFEVSLSWLGSDRYRNPFDPMEVDCRVCFTSPSGKNWVVPGFWDGQGWKVRFAARKTGAWRYRAIVVDARGARSSTTLRFRVIPGPRKGWLRQSMNDPHYLRYDNGDPFYGIGHNRPWGLSSSGGLPSGENLLGAMAGAGMNFLNYWLAPWDCPLVDLGSGYDRYNQKSALKIDRLLEAAEAHGIQVMLTIWPHDSLRDRLHIWKNGKWFKNPFNRLTSCHGFFHKEKSWTYQEKLYRYMIARWGYSTSLAAWHLICEVNGTNAYGKSDSWFAKINRFFIREDPFRHLTTGSKSKGLWKGAFARMDLPQVHSYEEKGDPIGVAEIIARRTRDMWNSQSKPNFVGEFGTNLERLQPYHLHNGLWAGLTNGAAIAPLDWNDGGSWGDMSQPMYDTARRLRRFVADVPFHKLGLRRAKPKASRLKAWGMTNGTFAFCWFLNPSSFGTTSGKSFTLKGLKNGTYRIEWYDTWTGDTERSKPIVVTGGKLSAPIPEFSADIACKIREEKVEEPNSGGSGPVGATVTSAASGRSGHGQPSSGGPDSSSGARSGGGERSGITDVLGSRVETPMDD